MAEILAWLGKAALGFALYAALTLFGIRERIAALGEQWGLRKPRVQQRETGVYLPAAKLAEIRATIEEVESTFRGSSRDLPARESMTRALGLLKSLREAMDMEQDSQDPE